LIDTEYSAKFSWIALLDMFAEIIFMDQWLRYPHIFIG